MKKFLVSSDSYLLFQFFVLFDLYFLNNATLLHLIIVKAGQVSPTLSLARYLRENLALTGTKIMCSQAGCGACVVTAYVPEASTIKGYKTISINSVILNFV